MSVCTVRLLKAASDIVGGTAALAGRLGIDEALLAKYLADHPPLPDPLLLKAVDIILAERQSRFLPDPPAAPLTAKAAT